VKHAVRLLFMLAVKRWYFSWRQA